MRGLNLLLLLSDRLRSSWKEVGSGDRSIALVEPFGAFGQRCPFPRQLLEAGLERRGRCTCRLVLGFKAPSPIFVRRHSTGSRSGGRELQIATTTSARGSGMAHIETKFPAPGSYIRRVPVTLCWFAGVTRGPAMGSSTSRSEPKVGLRREKTKRAGRLKRSTHTSPVGEQSA